MTGIVQPTSFYETGLRDQGEPCDEFLWDPKKAWLPLVP